MRYWHIFCSSIHLTHHHHHHLPLSLSLFSHHIYPSSSHLFLFTYPYYIDLYSFHSFLFIHPSINPSIYLLINPPHLSTYSSVCISICAYLCAYLYTYQWMICMTMSRDEFVENTRNRLVTIVGTSVCAQRAHLLINQRLQVNKSIHQSMNEWMNEWMNLQFDWLIVWKDKHHTTIIFITTIMIIKTITATISIPSLSTKSIILKNHHHFNPRHQIYLHQSIIITISTINYNTATAISSSSFSPLSMSFSS